ncbi:MAG TPA: hypothetical protein VJU18_17845, partial [Vicinamibacteria bacterium]|nr:hypothetical protein [Vicinamibacteria bacterium]
AVRQARDRHRLRVPLRLITNATMVDRPGRLAEIATAGGSIESVQVYTAARRPAWCCAHRQPPEDACIRRPLSGAGGCEPPASCEARGARP